MIFTCNNQGYTATFPLAKYEAIRADLKQGRCLFELLDPSPCPGFTLWTGEKILSEVKDPRTGLVSLRVSCESEIKVNGLVSGSIANWKFVFKEPDALCFVLSAPRFRWGDAVSVTGSASGFKKFVRDYDYSDNYISCVFGGREYKARFNRDIQVTGGNFTYSCELRFPKEQRNLVVLFTEQ